MSKLSVDGWPQARHEPGRCRNLWKPSTRGSRRSGGLPSVNLQFIFCPGLRCLRERAPFGLVGLVIQDAPRVGKPGGAYSRCVYYWLIRLPGQLTGSTLILWYPKSSPGSLSTAPELGYTCRGMSVALAWGDVSCVFHCPCGKESNDDDVDLAGSCGIGRLVLVLLRHVHHGLVLSRALQQVGRENQGSTAGLQ